MTERPKEKRVVLVVEDDENYRKILACILEDFDYEVVEAYNGKTALGQIEVHPPDISLIDIRLPDMNGLEVLTLFKKRFPDAPAIMVSGTNDPADVVQAMRLGAWDFMLKPIPDLSAIQDTIERALAHAESVRHKREVQKQLEAEILRNAQETQQLNEKLRLSETRFRTVLERSQDIVYQFSLDSGKYDYMSPSVRARLGFSFQEIASMTSRELIERIHHMDRRSVLAYYRDILRSDHEQAEPHEIEYRWLHRDEEYRWLCDNCAVVRDEVTNQPLARVGNIRDITKQKKAERERLLLEKKIHRAQQMESLGTLAGGVAHDFNNLMTIVISNARQITKRHPEDRPVITPIIKAAERASELTEQMLSYSGKGHFPMKPIDLSTVVKATSQMIRLSLSHGARIQLDLSPQPVTVVADFKQIGQVISNLVTNADEAMGDNDGIIRITTGTGRYDREYLDRIFLGEEMSTGKCAYLEITDEGCGMTEETRKRIFEPFFTTKFMGRGLGLSAVFGIIRRHKGALDVRGEKGQGCSFRVLFPHVVESFDHPVDSRDSTIPAVTRGTVLLVDDEELVRFVSGTMFRQMGYNVVTANDGKEALDKFRAKPEQFDCVILDLVMPYMSGEECLSEIRTISETVPILVTSAYSDGAVMDRISTLQEKTAFLQKPFRQSDLSAKISALMDGK